MGTTKAGGGVDVGEPAALKRWIDRFVEEALVDAEVDDFVRAVDEEIVGSVTEIAADPGLTEELHASTRAHWRSFLVALGDEYRLALPSAAVAQSQSIARRGLDVDVLLKVYRVAHRAVSGTSSREPPGTGCRPRSLATRP